MKYYATKISDNIAETPEGYLICIGVSIGRTGVMDYGKGETPIDPGPDGVVKVSRDEDEVFRPETIASFEGKPFTIKHPVEFVNPDNWKELAKGVIQNVRRGEGDQKDDLICDLLITDQLAISLVKKGMRGLSCGYEADYIQTGEGKGKQVNLIGNHLALVEEGRAGAGYEIKDHKIGARWMKKSLADTIKSMFIKVVDEAVASEEKEKKSKDAESKPQPGAPAVMDASMYDELVKVCNAMSELVGKMKPKDDKEKEEKPKDEDKEKEKKPEDDEESSLESRLKALEAAVEKMLESESEESGDDDEDKDKSKDDDEEEENEVDDEDDPEMVGDTAARAEILAPGIKLTKDVKSAALKAAYKTKDGKEVIDALTSGKGPDYSKSERVETIFIAASELMKSKRTQDLTRTKTGDFNSAIFNNESHMTPEKMNEINAKRYNTNK